MTDSNGLPSRNGDRQICEMMNKGRRYQSGNQKPKIKGQRIQ